MQTKQTTKSRLEPFALDRAFTFFECGPVMLLSAAKDGQNNVMTASCHASMGFEPTVGVMLGAWNYSYHTLLETGECVACVPGADLMRKTIAIGNCSGADIDKFKTFRLTPQSAKIVKAPLISECLKCLECVVERKIAVGGAYLFVLRGVAAWINPHRKERRAFHAMGDGTFVIDGRTVDMRDKMTKWQDCI
ncbi:MAG: flavin reductase family protein [Helicobacteraceae bacterium]|jgi:flavin reductase (DIM6/NTAB) family NADH-FMN oxidoreductase RutF|nr:flavin reductase family protein [Helicobacteraceae bacterium]